MSFAHEVISNGSTLKPWQSHSQEFDITGEMQFEVAAKIWLGGRSVINQTGERARGYIRLTTERGYSANLQTLSLFFAGMRLCDIRLDHLQNFQRARVQGAPPFIRRRRPNKNVAPGPCPASPKKANQELGVLIRVLKAAHLWSEEQQKLYQPLNEDIPAVPRALRRKEQQRWLDVAASHPRWNVIHWYSLLAFDTLMSTNEIRALKLGDINLQQGVITVPPEGSKVRARCRQIQIAGPEAAWALERLLQRARELGAHEPQHYLFPARDTPHPFDPTRPMSTSGIKKQWQEVRVASDLRWFRPYDTRHTAITRLAEAGVPIATIMKRAGHVSPKMTEHYTHISDKTELEAVRMAQRYNGSLGSEHTVQSAPRAIESRPSGLLSSGEPKSVPSADLIGQLLRSLQEQCGLTVDQLRGALLAQTLAPTHP